MTRWCNLRRFWLRSRLCRPSTHSLGQTPGRPPSFPNEDTPLPPGRERVCRGVSSAALGHDESPPQTSSKLNALRTLVGGQAWTLAAQASRQPIPTHHTGPLPLRVPHGALGCRMGHTHVPGEQAREVRAPDSPGPGLCLQHLGLADTARAGMPVAPAGTSSLKSQYWPRRPRRGRQARGQSW